MTVEVLASEIVTKVRASLDDSAINVESVVATLIRQYLHDYDQRRADQERNAPCEFCSNGFQDGLPCFWCGGTARKHNE